MRPTRTSHERCVDGWLATHRHGDDDDAPGLLLLVGIRAVWERARPSLGIVTLAAICDRALATAHRAYPGLSRVGLRVTNEGVVATGDTAALQDRELLGAERLILVELLDVLGGLTAETLTGALHTALTAARADAPRSSVHRAHASRHKTEPADS